MCVRVCKAPEQMAGDVRLRHTIDFGKQISSLVKQKAPLGPREGEKGGDGRREGQTALVQPPPPSEPKPGKNEHVRGERNNATF